MNSRKFWVYLGAAQGQNGFKIALLPFHYRKKPVRMEAFSFVSRRVFPSERQAKQEAGWLFGDLAWKPTGTQQRAAIQLLIKSTNA
jgi:hypothetical protein